MAGENLADVLKHRASGLSAPMQMCDALSRNVPKLIRRCVRHRWQTALRTDAGSSWMWRKTFLTRCLYVLENIGRGVCGIDAEAREQGLSWEALTTASARRRVVR